jgi:hypothetical protein
MSSDTLPAAISTLLARQEIADLAQQWGRARDQGRWEDLARTFHPGGRIKVMWFEGSHEDFIAACAKRFVPGRGTTKHFFGVSLVEVNGERALAETIARGAPLTLVWDRDPDRPAHCSSTRAAAECGCGATCAAHPRALRRSAPRLRAPALRT